MQKSNGNEQIVLQNSNSQIPISGKKKMIKAI